MHIPPSDSASSAASSSSSRGNLRWTRGGGAAGGNGSAGVHAARLPSSRPFSQTPMDLPTSHFSQPLSIRGSGRGGNKSRTFNGERSAGNALTRMGALVDDDDNDQQQQPMSSSTRVVDEGGDIEGMDNGEDANAARKARFGVKLDGNRYPQLQRLREKERQNAIAKGLIQDPSAPSLHSDVRVFKGTCENMCPVYEIEEREAKLNVDKWELLAGTTNRIDHSRAVKAYHRSAAGNEQPLPTDVRTPAALKRTLNYLFETLLAQDPTLRQTHSFIRDRTRSIRQDFTVQHEQGDISIECHERMARYHIHVVHILGSTEGFSVQQEMEQLRKVLTSLIQFYSDKRASASAQSSAPSLSSPNEAEFCSYLLLTHIFDADILRQTEALPANLFHTPAIQLALSLAYLAQRSNDPHPSTTRIKPNSALSQNFFTRLFKQVRKDSTPYLVGCLMESHFGEIRKAALLAICSSGRRGFKPVPAGELASLLGCDGLEDLEGVCEEFGLKVDRGQADELVGIELNRDVVIGDNRQAFQQRLSKSIVDVKRQGLSNIQIINGSSSTSSASTTSSSSSQQSTTNPFTRSSFPQSRLSAQAPVFQPKSTTSTSNLPTQPTSGFTFGGGNKGSTTTSAFTAPPTYRTSAFETPSSSTFGTHAETTEVLGKLKSSQGQTSFQKNTPPFFPSTTIAPTTTTTNTLSAATGGNPFAFGSSAKLAAGSSSIPPISNPFAASRPRPTSEILADTPIVTSPSSLSDTPSFPPSKTFLSSAPFAPNVSQPTSSTSHRLASPSANSTSFSSSQMSVPAMSSPTPSNSSILLSSSPLIRSAATRPRPSTQLSPKTLDVLTKSLLSEILNPFLRSTASQALSLVVLDEIEQEDEVYASALNEFKLRLGKEIVKEILIKRAERVVKEQMAEEWRRRWGLRISWGEFGQAVKRRRAKRKREEKIKEQVAKMGLGHRDEIEREREPELTLTDLIHIPRSNPTPAFYSPTNSAVPLEPHPLHRSLAIKPSNKRPRSTLAEDEFNVEPTFFSWIDGLVVEGDTGAGRAHRRSAGSNFVDADAEKGVLSFTDGGDDLLHLYWRPRQSSNVALDLIIFPGDASFAHVPESGQDNVFALTFESSAEKHFFWFQAADAPYARFASHINSIIEDPEFVPPADEPVSVPTTSAPSSALPPATPAHQTIASVTPQAPNPVRQAQYSDAELARLRDIIGGGNIAELAEPEFDISLNDILTPQIVTPILASEQFRASLFPHLPSDLPISNPPTTSEVRAIIESSQFQDGVRSLDRALRTGALAGMMQSLGLPPSAGSGVESFLRAIGEAAQGEQGEQEGSRMDTD
ncbi:Nuclear protein export factor [Phaffia rhodozyma]|uniref:Nuclear protein export factor n=1 Tax=Phaffia rhodozyma TaxID=264483 RepID=A0A0F7SMZ2_PHARH|nr:Nuclear protein export factor [Phaffia rhodozyma]